MGASYATVEGLSEIIKEAIDNTMDELAVLKAIEQKPISALEAAKADNEFWERRELSASLYTATGSSPIDLTGVNTKIRELTVLHQTNRHVTVEFNLSDQDLARGDLENRLTNITKRKISSELNSAIIDTISTGSLLIRRGVPTGYDDMSAVAVALDEAGVGLSEERMIAMTSEQGAAIAKELGNRSNYASDEVKKAYGKSLIATDVARMTVIQNQYTRLLTNCAVTTALVNGANQIFGFSAFPAPSNNGKVDCNYQTFAIDTLNAGAFKVGDRFTIDNVFALNMSQVAERRQSTGKLKTFTIVAIPAGGGAGNYTITPAIFPRTGGNLLEHVQYANVDSVPADNATIRRINTTTQQVCPFWVPESILFTPSEYNLGSMQNAKDNQNFGKFTTEQGLTFTVSKEFSQNTYITRYRINMFYGLTNIDPERNGLLLFNQA